MRNGRMELQGGRYRRVTCWGNEKVEGVAAVMCWEVDVVDKVEIRQKRKELSCLRVRRFITGMLKSPAMTKLVQVLERSSKQR